ncbi:MAG: DUF177 domain-containing protein [Hyphomicrobium sp.]
MTTQSTSPLAWHYSIKSAGSRVITAEREATPADLARMTTDLDVLSVDAFETRYTITPQSGDCFLLTGGYTARLTQACVVTLEPVPQILDEAFSISFCPPNRIPEPEGKERPVLDVPDVEVLTGDEIEVGRVLFELLGAAIDPYPRKAEAEFSWNDPKSGPDVAEKLNPFAALSKLKNER